MITCKIHKNPYCINIFDGRVNMRGQFHRKKKPSIKGSFSHTVKERESQSIYTDTKGVFTSSAESGDTHHSVHLSGED